MEFTTRNFWNRVFPALSALMVAGVGGIAEASNGCAPLLQSQAAAHASLQAHAGAHAQLMTGVWELARWIEPHSARPCGSGLGHVAVFGVIALVFIAALRFRYAANAARMDLARRMVERGMTPPSEIFSANPRNDLRRGLVLLGAGAGLLVYGFASNPDAPSVAGLIPSFIGIGYLLSHRFARGS
jgi:hypothetical protein